MPNLAYLFLIVKSLKKLQATVLDSAPVWIMQVHGDQATNHKWRLNFILKEKVCIVYINISVDKAYMMPILPPHKHYSIIENMSP